MTEALRVLLQTTDLLVLVYFAVLNSVYAALVIIGSAELAAHVRRERFSGLEEIYRSPLTRPVSVLIPAHNESAGIIESVRAMLSLRYPEHEVVVVDDGSTDDTFERLREEYDLVEIPMMVPDDVPTRKRINSTHVPRLRQDRLVVVRKDNGGKTDALNVGLNVASYPLVCMVDADGILDPRALLWAAKPFADDPLRVVATGGVVRLANGCTVIAGRVVDVRMPRRWLARIQVVEYLRSFLFGRTGWSRIGGLIVISGAFGVFRRDLVVNSGGLRYDTVGEDAELVVRLHHKLLREHADYRIEFVGEPIAWTEAPETFNVLGRQRKRWHRGLAEIMSIHRKMIGNPRYRQVGMMSMPFYLLFELLAPIVELAGLILIPAGILLGAVNVDFAWQFLLLAYAYATLVTVSSMLIEEIIYHRFNRTSDVVVAAIAALLENIGYRQFTAWARLRGLWAAIRQHPATWGEMTRRGFTEAESHR
ncbi:cellulose synthase/poly-beta-1,6-N-acetylglucosamine synthase-like glycosyltransferase [Saccharomonospora amisosensis]|uniref:Cellulose synthase/poly-beta-1,6-N-acetylglucosamine synthase-like glycosyltransferase n=1 Tax=Saccharomonospora amisosensis TaxID=1128677 RepID=A0A7X5UMP8_9PSEU|nr:glycosyltransferase [Saccharomonospora amisosensis]NIJ10849.1 cellulose synthase/poly-beta-1,6-N-acetylglucosamine synthase-like glycosyltransferase [Saccharomonospora amisosensis]